MDFKENKIFKTKITIEYPTLRNILEERLGRKMYYEVRGLHGPKRKEFSPLSLFADYATQNSYVDLEIECLEDEIEWFKNSENAEIAEREVSILVLEEIVKIFKENNIDSALLLVWW